MRIFVLLPLLIVLGMSFSAAQDAKPELRTWTAVNGKEVEAEFISNEKGVVKLKLKSGKIFEVPLNKLSKADQDFLKAKSSPKEPTRGEAPVSPSLKYEIKGDAVTITGGDKKVSGALTILATIEGKAVTSIGNGAFMFCSSLTSITIPDGVTSIGHAAFLLCSSLTSIPIPDSVTSIGDSVFDRCTSLTSITIPKSVTSIGHQTFDGCNSLTSITIGNGVTSIGVRAFSRCTSLTAVTFLGNAPKAGEEVFYEATPTIYRKPEAKGWGETFAGRPVKMISEKP